jgi:hypothetical protein
MYSIESLLIFSEEHVIPIIRVKAELATHSMLVSCLAYSLTLKMEVICSSETSVDFQQMTQHHMSEDRSSHHERNMD